MKFIFIAFLLFSACPVSAETKEQLKQRTETYKNGFESGLIHGMTFGTMATYCNLIDENLIGLNQAQASLNKITKNATKGIINAKFANQLAQKNNCKLKVYD
ncbi:MAG: hypothetical protein CL862_14160 [Cyanobium sp. NAT70]|nr:hypothetical protein [Cyanobium sp. NAT70]|tara:strand:- start:372 stop:677 length:306 start_codon:yes stop_codon:yes gene_type:complete